MTVRQFDEAIDTLRRLQMVELDGQPDEQRAKVSDHGAAWLMANFHWVDGDRATLEANGDGWVMTAPENDPSSPSSTLGSKDS
jgi:hypothetical protein